MVIPTPSGFSEVSLHPRLARLLPKTHLSYWLLSLRYSLNSPPVQIGLGDSLLSLKESLWDFIERRGLRLWDVVLLGEG